MSDIIKKILENISKNISKALFEGANIVLYTDDKNFFLRGEDKIKELVNKFKKRIELRADKDLLMSKKESKKIIKEIVSEDAEITNIIFDTKRSRVIIEAKKPGIVIGKGGSILEEIRNKIMWSPKVQRSPAIKSKITENIRSVLYQNNNYRRKFLNKVGKKIYKSWNPEKIKEWVRLTFLGGARQVGRSCLLLQTPGSKIMLDCGVDIAADENNRFPHLNVPEFDINEIDAIILSHAHLDHCLPPSSPVLTSKGYKNIDEIKVGDYVISMDWNTGEYTKSKCLEKTKTKGHKKIFSIKTPYSKIESSPNHKFFTFRDLRLKEIRADELKEGMLLPSNLLHKKVPGKEIKLSTDVSYEGYRKKTKIPNRLNPELAEFLGYFIGDGHKSSEFSLRLTDNSVQVLEHHKKLVLKLFNHESIIREHSDKSKNAHILEINNVEIIRFLEKNFSKMFSKSRNVSVPEKIKKSTPEVRRAFLRGFADAEGSVTNIIKISTFSDKMLEDMSHLFSLENIPSNIKSDKTICLNSKHSIYKFYKDINFSTNYKRERLRELVKDSGFYKQDLLPVTPKVLRKILEEAGMLGRVNNSPNLSEILPYSLLDLFRRKRGYSTRETVKELVNLLKRRLAILRSLKSKKDLYSSRQALTFTREEISNSTELKDYQIQTIEEDTIVAQKKRLTGILVKFIENKISETIVKTQNNLYKLKKLLSLNVIWEKIKRIDKKENHYPYLVDIETENKNFVSGNIIVHNSGLTPYLYKMGYKGPCYMTKPTRDIASLMALDFIDVAYKKAKTPLYSSKDIKKMVKHSICLDYNEVNDIAPDVRLTLYNAGHALGSAMIHLNIGNGLHNLLYTADFKFGKTKLLDSAVPKFPRLETMVMESTYGSRKDKLPPRKNSDEKLIKKIKETIERGGKVLVPELGLGRAQETMLIVEQAIKKGELPKIPIYIDGMIWDINAIHTAYPNFLSGYLKNLIFQGNNPFVSDIFQRVGSSRERKEVIEGGPCLVLATSGMLVGGASVEYFKNFSENPKNSIVFVCYQGAGSLGREIQSGSKEVLVSSNGNEKKVKVNLDVSTISGLTAHSGRGQLLSFVNHCKPKPRKIIINHGEASKCTDLASTLHKLNRVETICPRNLETLRIK